MNLIVDTAPVGADKFKEIMRLLKEDADTRGEADHKVIYQESLIQHLLGEVPRMRTVYNKIKNKDVRGYQVAIIDSITPQLRTVWLLLFSMFFSEGLVKYSGVIDESYFSLRKITKSHMKPLQHFVQGYAFWHLRNKAAPNIVNIAQMVKQNPGRLLRYIIEVIVAFPHMPDVENTREYEQDNVPSTSSDVESEEYID